MDVRRKRAAELQRELRDLLSLAVVGDHVRWVLVDDDGELAEWLAETVPQWRALADRVAERLVALGVPPDGRVRSLAEDISLNWVPDGWLDRGQAERLLAERLHIVSSWARVRHSQAADAETAQLLETVAARLEHASVRHGAASATAPIRSDASNVV
jgi:starvation-inducible DNA-binding protein